MTGSKISIVCVAGGRGERFGGDKLTATLGTKTVLESSLFALRRAFPVAPMAVVVASTGLPLWRERLATEFDGLRWVEGGLRRQDSVRRGVDAMVGPGIEVVAIHDGARPLVHPSDVRAVVGGLGAADGAILGQPAADTVKQVDARGYVLETLPRESIFLAQTPQVFRIEALRRAWELGDFNKEWTDEAALLESLGMSVTTVPAEHPNPKLTTQSDLGLLRALCADRR